MAGTYGGANAGTGASGQTTNPFGEPEKRFVADTSSPIDTGYSPDTYIDTRDRNTNQDLPSKPGQGLTRQYNPPTSQTAGDLMGSLYAMSGSELTDLQKRMVAAQYLTPAEVTGTVDNATRRQYAQLLQDTYLYQQYDQNLTPDDLLNRRAAIDAALGADGSGRGGRSGRGGVSTSSRVDLSDPITAGFLIDKTLEKAQGHRATPEQKAAFTAALNSYQTANPTTSTTSTDGAGNSSTVTNSAQVDPGAFADQYARTGNEGVATNTHTVGTDYYAAALSVLKAGGR